MDIITNIKKFFKHKEEPKVEIPKPIQKIPKFLLAEYQQNFSVYDSFHNKHRNHQKIALKRLEHETVGQISIPTGTGKTRIQVDVHLNDMIEKTKQGSTGVYVIGAHRLALCSQLLYDIVELAIPAGLRFDILYVGSERFSNDNIRTILHQNAEMSDNIRAFDDTISKGINTTRQDEVLKFVQQAKANNRHVICVSTYHSFHKLALIPKIDICTYDEAHITLGEDFSDNIDIVKPIIEKNFFFTATRKIMGIGGGMDNADKYGEVLYEVSPRKMIEAGEIVPPRLHSIRISEDNLTGNYENTSMLVKTIAEGFTRHKELIKEFSANRDSIGAKLLISCSGSKELKEIIESSDMKRWCEDNNVKLFSFSSNPDIGYYYNFERITRNEIFLKMEALVDSEDAILMHIDILTEGIDLPSITGVMPLRNLNQSKLIQTLGRATRLLKADRIRLYNNEILPTEHEEFIKPYCWIIIPQHFSSLGDFEQMKRVIRNLMNAFEVTAEEFSSCDRFLAEHDDALPKVTGTNDVERKEKICNLTHVFEEILVESFNEEMDNLTPEEQYDTILQELKSYA
jgi:superfamily II DNA or RNA helicase